MRNTLWVLLSVSALPAQTGTWNLIQTANTPPALIEYATAYDQVRQRLVLFGGFGACGGPRFNTTWEYDGQNWSQRTPPASPPAQRGRAVYDTVRQRTVLLLEGSSHPNTETWEWDGTTWTRRQIAGPSSDQISAFAYDTVRQRAVLFSSFGNAGNVSGTWEYDGNIWQQRTSGGPMTRDGAAMAFDSARGVCVLFGGNANGIGYLADTWEWNGSYWLQHFGVPGPSARVAHTMAFDSGRNRTVLYGGAVQTGGGVADTWEWDGLAWRQIVTASTPGPQYRLSLAYDSVRGVVVLPFPRASSPCPVPATYEYTALPVVQPSFVLFGSGCNGPAGTPHLAAQGTSLPRLGQQFTVQLTNLPNSPFSLPFGVIGFDATTWNNQPLPVSLDPLGFTGCSAFLAPAQSVTLTNANGTANWSIAVPTRSMLAGLDFYLQGAVLAPGFNPGGLVFSNAGHGVVGTP